MHVPRTDAVIERPVGVPRAAARTIRDVHRNRLFHDMGIPSGPIAVVLDLAGLAVREVGRFVCGPRRSNLVLPVCHFALRSTVMLAGRGHRISL
jgi:hypothetical protein